LKARWHYDQYCWDVYFGDVLARLFFEASMNKQFHTSALTKTLVVNITGQVVPTNNEGMSDEAHWLIGETKAPGALLDLKALGRLAGMAAIYGQMADAVRSAAEIGSSLYLAPWEHDTRMVVVFQKR
jgi:hypothetical protein